MLLKQGLVTNLGRPGANITGMTAFASELAGKRLELLREATPKVSRVALLWNPPGSSPDYMKDTQTAARSFGVTLQSVEIRTADDFERGFVAVLKGRPRPSWSDQASFCLATSGGLWTSHQEIAFLRFIRGKTP
jgi:ABC-type uncharacterized transport system substrate-binding protein